MQIYDGRSDKYALTGTVATILTGVVCAYIPGGAALAPILVPAIAGIWGSLILGQKYSDAKTGGATSAFAKKGCPTAEPTKPEVPQ